MIKISIIVTSYNIERYIEQCLTSIVNQTLKEIEIIIVDDGSSDSTPEIIEKYAQNDPRIVPVLLSENSIGGVATAANAGLDLAKGEYIGFADGDDFYELDMFEKLYRAAKTETSDLAMCKYLLFDDISAKKSEPAEAARWSQVKDRVVDLTLVDNKIKILRFIAVPWRKIYSRKLIEENNIRFPVVEYFWEDNPFHWQAVISANKIVLLDEVLCHHRVSRVGQTMSTLDPGLLKMFGHYFAISDWLKQSGQNDAFKVALLAWGISQYEWIVKRLPAASYDVLFDALRKILADFSQAEIQQALTDKGANTHKAVNLVKIDDKSGFLRYLQTIIQDASSVEAKPNRLSNHYISRGIDHMKANGIRSTAKIALSFLKFRLSNLRFVKGLQRRSHLEKIIRMHAGLIPVFNVTKNQIVDEVNRHFDERLSKIEDSQKEILKQIKTLKQKNR